MVGKVGFACKYLHPDQTQKKKILEEIQRPLTEKSTTIRWLNEQHKNVAEQRLWDIMVHNTQAVYKPASLMMLRPSAGLPHACSFLRVSEAAALQCALMLQ